MHSRWSAAAFAVIGSVGCGRLHFDPTGNADGSTADSACALGPWSAPSALTSVNSSSDEQGPTLTEDGLDLVFMSNRSGGPGMADFYEATRLTTSVPFGPPVLLSLSTANHDDGPTLSGDGLTLYFCTSPDISSGPCALKRATRSSRTAPFDPALLVPQLADAWGPYVTRDGSELFYTRFSTGLERATMSSGVPTPLGPITEINNGGPSGFAGLSADGLTIFFEGGRSPESVSSIHTATRPAVGMPFGPVTRVNEVSLSTSNDGDPEISDRDRTIVFASDRPGMGGFDLYIATRTCL